jgi:hypothetical protein
MLPRERLHATLPEATILVLELPTLLSWQPVCRYAPLLVRILQGRLGGHEVCGGVEFSRTTLETFILVQWGPTDNALPDDEAGILPTLRTHVGVSQLIMALRIHRRLGPATDGSDRLTASEVVAVCLYER